MSRTRLTKAELLVRLHRTERQLAEGGLQDLRAHEEELRTQNEQLLETQHSLEESRDRYVDLFDLAPVGYATLSAVGSIATANLTLARLLGVERRSLVRRSFRSFVAVADRRAFLDRLAERGPEAEMRSVDLHMIGDRGKPVPVRLSMRRMASGTIWTVITDLTEHARIEDERRQVELRELSAKEASAAKDRFLAVLSHELRTPLTPVLAAASSLVDLPETPPTVRALLEIVRRNVLTEARLIDDLLDVTRIEHGKLGLELETVDLHGLLREAAQEPTDAATAATMRCAVVVDLQATAPRVSADRTRLRQVVWNLLGNARRYSPDGGRITLRSRDDEPGWVRFAVVDEGVGIPADALPSIFEPFRQAGRRTPGMRGLGLGLAICRGIVAAHGGTIDVRSAGVGRGTTVEVRWRTTKGAVAKVPTAPPLVAERRLRILLVEDDEDSAFALSLLLKLGGHDVTVAPTCAAARRALAPPPDLLISDVDLPDGSGLELVGELRSRLGPEQPLPALALSGHGSAEDIRCSRAAGFGEHLVKPVERATLVAAIGRVTARLAEARERPPG